MEIQYHVDPYSGVARLRDSPPWEAFCWLKEVKWS